MPRTLPVVAPLAFPAVSLAAEPFSADIWADNWFELRINGTQVAEDSVPITTERSLSAESFTFEAERPFVIGLVAMDFKQNDTGLGYIGSRRQQMGDGGVIVQIRNASGSIVAVRNGDWQCLVTHVAPLDKACGGVAEPVAGKGACGFDITDPPSGWDRPAFDASDWPVATVYSARAIDPKGGYDRITWVREAEFIWGPDLEQTNTVLCRTVVE